MTRIDLHAHITPDAYARTVKEHVPIALPPWSLELTEAYMARHGIDAAVLSLGTPGVYFGDQGLANELARAVNEEAAAVVRTDPARYGALAFLPLPDVDAALAELAYALDVLGLDGVVLLSNVAGSHLGDPRWDALFDELERRRAYVFVHPTMPPAGEPLARYPVWLVEFPFETTRAFVSLLYSGTLARCPSIRIQLPHLGGTVPFLAHRLASLIVREPQFAAAVDGAPLDAMRAIYLDTAQADNRPALEATLAVTERSKIVFGTDWPYAALPDGGSDPAPGLDALGSDARAGIDHRNAHALVPRLADALP